ncbi:putative quinol monooxygenase [Bacillus massiliglaciei]|uniref:putative quinol monooxygenase n=1 Tax=Bacillus massiliglaciei TaxID=1816693 RepID=UPI0018FE18EF|nr:putative quinol monooxygenase [Bacillus massiliglaciei]
MYIVHVSIKAKEEAINDFIAAAEENRRNSLKEEGVLQFDLFQDREQSSQFRMIEVYRSQEDQLKHRETAHFARFKETTADLLVEPYTIQTFEKLFT